MEDLNAFLRRQPAAALADILIELANDHPDVLKRLQRLQLSDSPNKLAAEFRKTLAAWRRSQKYHDYKAVRSFAAKLELWLDQVARELAPKDPAVALDLFEAFIEADETFFENADDSGGDIGDVVRKACRHWLSTAVHCEAPEAALCERLLKLANADGYGAREGLLREANLLLSEQGMRELVAELEGTMALLVAKHRGASQLPYEVIKVSVSLSLIGDALNDPDVKARAILSYRPDPNAMQRETMARAYLEADRPEEAMRWLQDDWGHLDDRRQRLLAQAHSRLGHAELSNALRQELFEAAPSVEALHLWLDELPPREQVAAMERAGEMALGVPNPGLSAQILVELHREADAEAVLVAKAAAIDGADYVSLPPLATTLAERGRLKGATAIYRALLLSILERANARAYGHAARHLERLQLMSAADLTPLPPHEEFLAQLRSQHGRKTAFWSQVGAA
ncbi:Arc/MetJ-type ribon-helix-helix transcriptional regulator [Pelomonas aquatica]|uniref:Arc/MetJ-type ribon-helix-helix transcriptional regulator n=1 Tax=Pelomonas aquatica TaxID=431058 RepID=A0ABU1ZFU4_9BURK|nr:DUF6880 family protein [Pelomonas aquatica]MDR7299499.1 Arc/MetJ-type ribon-helix-helix transcriptional regulator [Pelomonas aquatica]